MGLRTLLLFFFVLAPLVTAGARADTTPTEAAAIAAAQNDHTAYTLPPDKLDKAAALYRIRVLLDFGGTLWSLVYLFLILQLGIAARLRDFAVSRSPNRWAQGFAFLFLFLLLINLLSLPLDLYGQHVRKSYGLSVQHWGSWFGDQGKSFALVYIFGGLGVMLLFFLIRRFPRGWWLCLWFPTMAFTVLGVFASPYVIDPLFNTFEPLAQSNPALVSRLEQVVARGQGIDIPPARMFLMKASDKVTTLNAYVTGFGASKRVVVWDTSIARGTSDEILFIFGHEMGHYVLGHVVRGDAVHLCLHPAVVFRWLPPCPAPAPALRAALEISGQDDWAALVVFVLVLSGLGFSVSRLPAPSPVLKNTRRMSTGKRSSTASLSTPRRPGRPPFSCLAKIPWLLRPLRRLSSS